MELYPLALLFYTIAVTDIYIYIYGQIRDKIRTGVDRAAFRVYFVACSTYTTFSIPVSHAWTSIPVLSLTTQRRHPTASAFDVSRVIESEWQFLLEVEFFYFSLIVPLYINVKEDCYL